MKRRMLLILLAFALLLASCGNKDVKSGLMIPEDASMVIHINSSSLSSKITWEEIKQSAWFLDMSKKSEDSTARQFFSNPGSSGINTKADIILYTKKQGPGSYMIIAGSVADANAFEKFCKTLDKKESKQVKKEKGFNYMSSENSAVVWNSTYFAFAGNSSLPDAGSVMNRYKRGSGETMDLKHEYLPDSLKIFGMEALSGKSDDNLESDKRFSSLIKDGNDIHFWINSGIFYSGMATMLPLDMKPLLEGNVSAISLNFDNGKIRANLKQYFGEKMSKLMSKSKTEPLSAAVINRIPSSNVAAVIAFNYSPDIVKEFLKVLGADAMADMILAKMDFSLDDFIKANKGQVLISFSDLGAASAPKPKKSKGADDEEMPGKKNNMTVLFATAVNDKASFEKMVTLIWDAAKKMKKGGDMNSKALPFSYKLENNWFAASNSAELTDKFLAGGDNKLPFTDKITGHPFAIYVDLQKIIGTMHNNFNAGDTSKAKAAINIWQDIVATGGEYKGDALQFEAEINMLDKNTNSLKQLNKYFDNLLHIKKGNFEIKEVTLEDVVQEEDKMEPPPPPPPKKKANK